MSLTRADELIAALQAIEANEALGIALLPAFIAGADLQEGRLVSSLNKYAPPHLELLYPPSPQLAARASGHVLPSAHYTVMAAAEGEAAKKREKVAVAALTADLRPTAAVQLTGAARRPVAISRLAALPTRAPQ